MVTPSPQPEPSTRIWNTAIWGGMAAAGAAALAVMLITAEKSEAGLLFGYSPARLLVFALTAAGAAAAGVCAAFSWGRPAWWRRLSAAAENFSSTPGRRFALILVLWTLFLALTALILLMRSAAARELVILEALFDRIGPLLIWLDLDLLSFGALLAVNRGGVKTAVSALFPLQTAVLLTIATGVYYAALKIFASATWDLRFRHMEAYIFLPAGLSLAWGLLARFYPQAAWFERVKRLCILAAIGVAFYTIYSHTSQWMDWQGTPSKAYWHLAADAFLHGRLYLIDPPTTHDLTFYNGRWYVPNPPLPGLIMVPLVALRGVDGVSTVTFSIVVGALCSVLVFLILERAASLKLIPTSRAANVWITALFAAGTCFWWLSLMGRMWFISQQLTLFFAGLALLAALHKRAPWLAGLGLGAAVLSRPNVFTLMPFLLGIYIYLDQREGLRPGLKRITLTAVQVALPVALAALGLLYYNYLRFGDWLDFGYVGITSSEWLTSAVRTYGMFNVHFLGTNLKAMLLKLPEISWENGCLLINPTREGISVFAMTPALIFLFRRFRWNWWTAGAWLSIILTAGLLIFYHNTGAWQLGYRYLMDYILPVLLLLAIGVGDRPSWLFKGLVLVSIIGNFLGIVWWFNRWWC